MGMIKSVRRFLKFLGPGIITGASDNDPAGISTYSVTGVSTGYSLLWLSLYTLPMTAAIQVMAAKIGLVTKKGLTTVIKNNYGLSVVIVSVVTLIISNIITIGADLAGMAAAVNLLFPSLKIALLVPVVAIFTALTEVFFSYKILERYLKWVLLILAAYIFAGFFSYPDWPIAIYHTLVPTLKFDKTTLTVITAVLGTTLSPYLFFWQVSEEIEELRAEHRKRVSRKQLRERLLEVDFGFFLPILYSSL